MDIDAVRSTIVGALRRKTGGDPAFIPPDTRPTGRDPCSMVVHDLASEGAVPSCGMLFWFVDEVPGGGLGPDQQVTLIKLWPTIFLKPDVHEIAESFRAQIREIQPAGPYLLGGPSFCALIALEVAS